MASIVELENELLTDLTSEVKHKCPGIGDQVIVKFEIVEGDKSRIKQFDGLVIAVKNGGNRVTFTVRKDSLGTGVERIFPLHSPFLKAIELKKRHKVRRAKLYYQRDLSGKKARLKQIFTKKQA